MQMRPWYALIGAPLLALSSISVAYALVPVACASAAPWLLHAVILGFLLSCLAVTLFAVPSMRAARDPFLGLVAVGIGAFFSLVVAAQWAYQLFVPPCLH